VPALIVPDNPRALVSGPDRYEPELNRATAEFAHHYDTVILPARPRKPQDKAKVESGVQVVERWILARLRHRRFFSVAELDAAILELLPALNTRPFKKLPGCRQEAFAWWMRRTCGRFRFLPSSSLSGRKPRSTSTITSNSRAITTACRMP
jgi:transposase